MNTTASETFEQYKERTFKATSSEMILYGILFIIGSISNIAVIVQLLTKRKKLTPRVNLLIMNLTCADLMVCFITVPIEIGWRVTVSWDAGPVGCKLLMFLRVFGFYLSSFILICISLDRYYALVKPLQFVVAKQRNFWFLTISWLLSFILSLPQVSQYILPVH